MRGTELKKTSKLDVREKIVTFWRTKDKDAFWEEATNASKGGAKGMIMVDLQPLDIYGNPRNGLFQNREKVPPIKPNPIPAVTVSKEDGRGRLGLT